MPRGGKRDGAGGKFKWSYGKTKVIRVPEALVDKVLEYVASLDQDNILPVTGSSLKEIGYDHVTPSKVINLSGISIRSFKDGPGIYLADLVRMGYEIRPEALMRSVKLKSGLEARERVKSVKSEIELAINDLKT